MRPCLAFCARVEIEAKFRVFAYRFKSANPVGPVEKSEVPTRLDDKEGVKVERIVPLVMRLHPRSSKIVGTSGRPAIYNDAIGLFLGQSFGGGNDTSGHGWRPRLDAEVQSNNRRDGQPEIKKFGIANPARLFSCSAGEYVRH